MAVWGEIVLGVVNIVGSIFSNKKQSDAQKVAMDSAKRAEQAMQEQRQLEQAKYYQGEMTKRVETDIETWARFLKISSNDQAAVRAGAIAWLKSKGYVLSGLKTGAGYLPPPELITRYGGKMPDGSMPKNAMTNPIEPYKAADEGGFSFGGSSSNPFGIDEVTITDTKEKIKKAGMSPWLLLGLVGAGGYVLYNGSGYGRKGRKRRR